MWGDRAYGGRRLQARPVQVPEGRGLPEREVAARKQEMGWIYQSQDGNLDEGMKSNFSELSRQEEHVRIMDWQEHEGWNE